KDGFEAIKALNFSTNSHQAGAPARINSAEASCKPDAKCDTAFCAESVPCVETDIASSSGSRSLNCSTRRAAISGPKMRDNPCNVAVPSRSKTVAQKFLRV